MTPDTQRIRRLIIWPASLSWDEYRQRSRARKDEYLSVIKSEGLSALAARKQLLQERIAARDAELADLDRSVEVGLSARFPEAARDHIKVAVAWVLSSWMFRDDLKAHAPELVAKQEDQDWMAHFAERAIRLKNEKERLQFDLDVLSWAEDEHLMEGPVDTQGQPTSHGDRLELNVTDPEDYKRLRHIDLLVSNSDFVVDWAAELIRQGETLPGALRHIKHEVRSENRNRVPRIVSQEALKGRIKRKFGGVKEIRSEPAFHDLNDFATSWLNGPK